MNEVSHLYLKPDLFSHLSRDRSSGRFVPVYPAPRRTPGMLGVKDVLNEQDFVLCVKEKPDCPCRKFGSELLVNALKEHDEPRDTPEEMGGADSQ